MNTNTDRITCPDCDGSGDVEDFNYYTGWSSRVCQTCHGAGDIDSSEAEFLSDNS